jgi:lipopolysaccharide/colanic/teichoic acid biosynthesis glycosyltransferase
MRWLDVSLSALGLVVLAPVMLIVALAVKWGSPGPVLYRARRVGKDGRLFDVYKFRTMVADSGGGPRVTRAGDPRVTPVGRLLRRTKLDELPQLFNTLRGDMSLVGPRPEDPVYVESYSPEQRQVLRVKPGLTSAATLRHRDEEGMLTGPDWEETYRSRILPAKLQIELEYLATRTVWQDVLVLARTALAVLGIPGRTAVNRGAQCRT